MTTSRGQSRLRASYRDVLRDARVLVDAEERRTRIAEQVAALASQGEVVALADDLLDEVTGLVEWPTALRGSFDPDFLEVPAQALISAMKTHQKYFHLNDADSGALLPAFITVSNIESRDPDAVVTGNERVIRPRLSDAAFFFANDKQSPLVSRQERLASVVFQHHLGSLLDKTQRISAVATELASVIGADIKITERAAQLSKCDLVSEMVLEFPELQGIAGAHYAQHDGEVAAVAQAIEEHYYPRFAGDRLPASAEATALALADRLDTLVGIFGIGEPPTGSKDPFALRRASLAVVRMLIAIERPLPLRDWLQSACKQHSATLSADTADAVLQYILERLASWYDEQDIHISIVRAVLATGITICSTSIFGCARSPRLPDPTRQSTLPPPTSGSRISLPKRTRQMATRRTPRCSPSQQRPAYKKPSLMSEAALVPLMSNRDYQAALDQLAQLRGPVDDFFETVMVNAEDPDERLNRLRLLRSLRALFTELADLALLSLAAE